jgi:hypothetical protein
MSDVTTDAAPSGRHSFQETSTAGLGQSLTESWPWNREDTTMATTSGAVTGPAPVTERKDGDISITQRMVSATGGSILTALLGELHSLHKFGAVEILIDCAQQLLLTSSVSDFNHNLPFKMHPPTPLTQPRR